VLDQAASSIETSKLLRGMLEFFNTVPKVVVTDGGTEFKGTFEVLVGQLKIQRVVIAAYSQWMNGLAERFNDTLQTRVRAKVMGLSSYKARDVMLRVREAVREYNVTYHSSIKRSPHAAVFTYRPWIYPELAGYRPEGDEELFPDLEEFVEYRVSETDVRSEVPQVGEVWYLKNRKPQLTALEPRYLPCMILKREGQFMYSVQERSLKSLVNRAHLQRFPPKRDTPENSSQPVPHRPERVDDSPGGQGGHASPVSPVRKRPRRLAGEQAESRLRTLR
jgi:hypothetical protein